MLNEKTNEELQEFFERKTGMPVAEIDRNRKEETATIILDNKDVLNARRTVISFFVTNTECKGSPREFIAKKEKINNDWVNFLTATNNKNANLD